MNFRTYSRDKSIVFKKTNEKYGGLSNMAPGYPLNINGIVIKTSEALYQACRFPDKADIQRLIISERSPMTAKMRSKPFRKETREDWEDIKLIVMRWCLRVKLFQNWTKFSDLLLSTEDLPIVEESNRDAFWGAKPDENGQLIGTNSLGRLLMELRQEIQKYNSKRYNLNPPSIKNFLLLGNSIPVISVDVEIRNERYQIENEGLENKQIDFFDL